MSDVTPRHPIREMVEPDDSVVERFLNVDGAYFDPELSPPPKVQRIMPLRRTHTSSSSTDRRFAALIAAVVFLACLFFVGVLAWSAS